MKIANALTKQIRSLTQSFILNSFQIEFNNVSNKGGVIVWDDFKDISFTLKKVPYDELYNECLKEKAFNFMLLDGALIQLMYTVKNNAIVRHRLAYYPSPRNERFQDDSENFESNHFGNKLFSEIYERRAMVFPVRFDYDTDRKKYVEHRHSFSHLTLGNLSNCRIPVTKPLSPFNFLSFILKSFYFDKYYEHYDDSKFKCDIFFDSLLTENEKKFIHISL